ncbi:MAG: 16S rRNA (guanine(527)-N(7))-methyltransferase RsmG [Muribaculaceae bacterium]|nr:16S rRNA (guanine(527)-N(7))-methyltransferase RsmG [Roseburia sp.]MCM1430032.1 16S rRNA (guanine(527)-N(7))-methyltransferase RsmG [Muribaculaceae bacterium]MCM1492941.1 16S rRNA (guanine(527)-N(7))-methyltransferase RsmG [Muribaculaceae bacterium]
MNKFNNFLERVAEYNLSLSELQLNQFETYYKLLIETNQVMNLTAITEWDEVLEKHFLDSLAIAMVREDLHQGLKVMDMGTGAGFPGIPLKIVFPELEITLSDSLNKRVIFLQKVIEELKLKNISAIHSRAENLAKELAYREKYDLLVSRAVANLSTLAEYCLPFVRSGGEFISYKSGDCDEEVAAAEKAVHILGGNIREVKKFQLGESGRAFVIIDKVRATPKKFPRKAGTPSKEPLT